MAASPGFSRGASSLNLTCKLEEAGKKEEEEGEEKEEKEGKNEKPSLLHQLPPIPPEEPATEVKRRSILNACKLNDLSALASLATLPEGLINDSTRRIAWPILLGADSHTNHQSSPTAPPPHRDEGQVKLDVDRAFVYYPKESEPSLLRRKDELQDLIVETLRRHPALCYFQGYHDIVQVLLLVLGREKASDAVARLSLLRIRDFMLPSLSAAIVHLHLLPSILQVADPRLAHHLSHTQPFFALAATLTLYAHDIQEYGDIARLFDFFLAREAVIPLYFFAVIVMSRKEELLDIEPDEPEMLHSILCKLPKPLNLESLISRTVSLFESAPPERLPGRVWKNVSSKSVLKTTRDPTSLSEQSLAQGQSYFDSQAAQQRLVKRLSNARTVVWRHRRPAAAIGFAVGVGILSWWLRRDPWILRSFGSLLKRLTQLRSSSEL